MLDVAEVKKDDQYARIGTNVLDIDDQITDRILQLREPDVQTETRTM